ncbi:Brix domain-containing protein [Meloidogyne graminicola]|uniref:Ribosome production factor 2 homolog n=1 Tax=Meloidogyne graminicola TaxID=189291 RepID=A0A8S9ZJK0_9BILA|nr:Brix domain-containing protein [Meloidogyne graminicola]
MFYYIYKNTDNKDILDYSEAELDKLYEQWNENDPEEENEEQNRPKTVPPIDLNSLRENANSPDELLKMTKKGQSVMMFVSVVNPSDNSISTREFTEKISGQWQQSFFNNHIDAQNYVVDDDRILFLFKEGQQAWDARDFLVKQSECKEIQLEGRTIYGPGSSKMKVDKTKTHRGKLFLEDRAPKLIENDKTAIIMRGNKMSEIVGKALQELFLLKKPLATKLMRKREIHPFEDDTLLCNFSKKFDSSLFVVGSSSKKRPNTLTFGRFFDHQMLDMVELQIEKFVSSDEFKAGGVTIGTKPCILLQGPLFESDPQLKRFANLMVDWFRGPTVETVRLQGLELVIALTALDEHKIIFRVYRTILKRSPNSENPKVELVELGPQIDFRLDRTKLASDELFTTALKKPKPESTKPKDKNTKFDVFGNKVAKVHTGRQQLDGIQTRKVKALKRRRSKIPGPITIFPPLKIAFAATTASGFISTLALIDSSFTSTFVVEESFIRKVSNISELSSLMLEITPGSPQRKDPSIALNELFGTGDLLSELFSSLK